MFSFFKKTDQKIKKEKPSFEIELTAAVLDCRDRYAVSVGTRHMM